MRVKVDTVLSSNVLWCRNVSNKTKHSTIKSTDINKEKNV